MVLFDDILCKFTVFNDNDNTFIEHKYRLQMKIYIYIYNTIYYL